jgi:hypothetical protein
MGVIRHGPKEGVRGVLTTVRSSDCGALLSLRRFDT